MAVETWIHQYAVTAPIAVLFVYLAEPQSYLELSPLVTEVTNIQHGTDSTGKSFCRYNSVERFMFAGFIRYDNPIQVTMTLTPQRQIISDVQAPLNVSVRFVFDLEEKERETTITETITVHMPVILRGYTVQQAKAVQQFRVQTLRTKWAAH